MNLLETFNSIDLQTIHNYVADQKEEGLYLDFKTVQNSNLSSKDDKRTFCQSISGFANSSGGLIVWGVVASKNDQDIDCAKELKPIANIRRFLSRLNELTGVATAPIVEGVDHKILQLEDDSGFAVSLVPESLSTPHMALLGEQRYFKRSGDSFRQMEHFDLEDMFGRRKKPSLNMVMSIDRHEHDHYTVLSFKLTNTGRAAARYTNAIIEILAQDGPVTYMGGEGEIMDVSMHNRGRLVYQWKDLSSAILPNFSDTFMGKIVIYREHVATKANVQIRFACENFPTKIL